MWPSSGSSFSTSIQNADLDLNCSLDVQSEVTSMNCSSPVVLKSAAGVALKESLSHILQDPALGNTSEDVFVDQRYEF